MVDLRDLLDEAAPVSARPSDIDELWARAQRQVVARRVAVVAVVLVAVIGSGMVFADLRPSTGPVVGGGPTPSGEPSQATPPASEPTESESFDPTRTAGDLSSYQLEGWEQEEVLTVIKSRDRTEVIALGLDGAQREVVAELPPGVNSVRVSPDRMRVAYDDTPRDPSDIYVLDLATGETRLLVEGGHRPDWSPDGTEIAFDSEDGIEAIAIDSGERRLLVDDRETPAWSWDPVWSPDGTRLAFVRYPFPGTDQDPNWTEAEIVVLDLETGAETVVTRLPGEEFTPMWSPDGTRVAYHHLPRNQLRVVDLTTGEDWLVAEDMARAGSFSPDGTRIVYIGDRDVVAVQNPYPGENVWISWLDGSALPARLFDSPSTEGEPSWRVVSDDLPE